VEQISAVTPNSRGEQESTSESGKLFQAKVLQTEVMQEWASENAQGALLQVCKNNLYYIQNFFTEERTFKIQQEHDNPYWLTVNKKIGEEVLNNTSVGKYDVVISKTPFGRLAKEQHKNRTLEMINILVTLNPLFVDPKAVIDIYEPKNKQDWLTRIEKIEGITQQQTNAESAARQLEGQQNKFAGEAGKVKTGLDLMGQAQDINAKSPKNMLMNMLNEAPGAAA